MTSVAKVVAYVSCAFILIPARRDIVATYANLLPRDNEIMALLRDIHPAAAKWLWPMWGFNHCTLSALKLRAVYQNDQPMLQILCATAIVMTYLMIVAEADMNGQGVSMMGFIAICSLQCLSLGYLGFLATPGDHEDATAKKANLLRTKTNTFSNKHERESRERERERERDALEKLK